VTGAFTLPMPTIATAEAEFAQEDPARSALPVADEVERAFEAKSGTFVSLADFESLLEEQVATSEPMTTARIVFLIASGRVHEAERLARYQLSIGASGGFHFPSNGNFNEIALRYLTDQP
jgi:c-di-GMP-related signal transduction protein